MDQRIKSFDVAIIDPVGRKAGLDNYDTSLNGALNDIGIHSMAFSNFSDEKYSIKAFSFSFSKSFVFKLRMIIDLFKVLRLCKKANCKIIIIHIFHSSKADLLIVRIIRLFGFKLCIIVHDAESFIYKQSKLTEIASIADWIICHNRYTANEILEKMSKADISKVSVIPHGNYSDIVSVPVANNFLLDNAKIHVLFFGMIKKSKGLEVLLNSIKELPEEINLIIAGRNRDVSLTDFKNMINAAGASRINIINDYISNSDRHELFSKCDMVILPYHKVYQSGVLLMAMSYGLPVIASDIPGNNEIINGENGLLFQPRNSSQLADCIRKLSQDKQMRMMIGRKGKEYVERHHDWNLIAGKYKELFSC